MAKQYDNTNTGALFKNDKQGNEARPDYRGTLNVKGEEFWLSAWIKDSKAGHKYMQLAIQSKTGDTAKRPAAASKPDFDDRIPF